MAAGNGKGRPTTKSSLKDKADRMAQIRKNRREAGFTEVTVWVPEEDARAFRDLAWDRVDEAGREFPHRSSGPTARRERKRQ